MKMKLIKKLVIIIILLLLFIQNVSAFYPEYNYHSVSNEEFFSNLILYNKQIYINRITINTSSQNDYDTVKNILSKTDNNILKYIKEINIINSERIICKGNENVETIGCSRNYISPKEYTSIITVVSSDLWTNTYDGYAYLSSFEFIVAHEIGHTKGNLIYNRSEEYANMYATKFLNNQNR